MNDIDDHFRACAREVTTGVKDRAEACETEPLARQRDRGFRKAIVRLYERRCALCGIRTLTPEGPTAVAAARIVPWSASHDDLPANGPCLGRLCHGSFDEGLRGVGGRCGALAGKTPRRGAGGLRKG